MKNHIMKTYGEWRYSSTIHDLGIRWRWMVSFKPRTIYHPVKVSETRDIGG
jgi:hypothetical protein